MQSLYIFSLPFFLLFFFFVFPVSAQTGDPLDDETGPVGTTDDGSTGNPADQTPGWADLQDPQWGLAGLVSERLPHDACEMCFTVPNVDEFQIHEYVETDGPEAVLISRRIPNPAPLREGEVRDTVDEDGEAIWYIGTQGIVGPTDEELWSAEIPLSYIELRRIQRRHRRTIFAIPGVHGIGMGADGFVVSLLPEMADYAADVPTEIEGVPVTVEMGGIAKMWRHRGTTFRPIPTGAELGTRYGRGTIGPHVVRDRPHVPLCCMLWSLTAAHVVKPDVTFAANYVPIYQPGVVNELKEVGDVVHSFTLQRCDISTNRFCHRSDAPINETDHLPDVAAVQTAEGSRTSPYNAPWFDADPVRRLQYSATNYVNGPSGRIQLPRMGKRLKIWGSRGAHGTRGKVTRIDHCEVVEDTSGRRVKQCGVFTITASSVIPGDSGALVSYAGTSSRHVVGLLFAGDEYNNNRYVIPAMDIKDAFAAAGKGFSHYWGTRSGYRSPSTR